MEGFMMTPEVAEDFFRRCIARGAETEKERIAILQEIVMELRAIKLNEQDIKNQIRNKKVLHIKKDKPNE
jgi:hypothetical protein